MGQKKTARRKTAQKTTTQKAAVGKKTWIVTTSPERPMAEIVKDLSAAGLRVDQTLETIGVITVKSDDRAVAKARAIPGVTDVSPEHTVDIGPPGSSDTW